MNMGYEYKITVEQSPTDLFQAGVVLRALAQFTAFDEQHEFYEFREPSNTGKMPNVIIKIEEDEFYLCDFGASRDLIESITRDLRTQFSAIQMENYE